MMTKKEEGVVEEEEEVLLAGESRECTEKLFVPVHALRVKRVHVSAAPRSRWSVQTSWLRAGIE